MADGEVGRREPSGDRLPPRLRGRLHVVLRSAGHLAISAVERVRIANRAIVGLFETLARHRGAAEALLLRGRDVGRTAPLVSTIAYYRLLLRIGSGDLASIPPLRRQFGTVAPTEEEMWAVISLAGFDVDGLRLDGDRAVLRERLAPFIDAELHSTNASVVLEWLVGHDVYDLDDEHLGRHLEQRLTLACERRYEADCAPRSRSARASRRATIERLHQAGQDPISPVFLSGSTLLDAVTGRSDERRGELELGTFGDLAGLGETLARSGFSIEHLGSQHLRSRDERTQIAVEVHRFEVVDELASVKSLACVDDVVLYESAEDVVAQVDALGVDRLILEPDAAITAEDISNLDLTAGRIQVTRGSES